MSSMLINAAMVRNVGRSGCFSNISIRNFGKRIRPNPIIPAMSEHGKTTANAMGPQVIPSEVRQKNFLMAATLFSFVAGVYYYSISKMRNKDELAALLDKESK